MPNRTKINSVDYKTTIHIQHVFILEWLSEYVKHFSYRLPSLLKVRKPSLMSIGSFIGEKLRINVKLKSIILTNNTVMTLLFQLFIVE